MRDILADIDRGLERIRQRGGQDTIYYANLAAKREAIAGGAPYRITDYTEALIGGVGAMIATFNRDSDGQRLPARGSLPALWTRLIEAAEQSAVLYPGRPGQGELSPVLERGSVVMDANAMLCQNPSCQHQVKQVGGGHRQRLYCSETCRQQAFRARQVAARRRRCVEQVQEWGNFQAATVDYLVDLLMMRNEEGARRLAALIVSEQHAQQAPERSGENVYETHIRCAARIAKLEKQVEIQRERLGQYYQRCHNHPEALSGAK
jgi:hypothetical protein